MKKVEIPFGASDSEPYYEEIIIPEGLEAVMEDGNIIIRRKGTKDEKIRKTLLESFEYQIKESYPDKEYLCGVKLKEIVAWLEKQAPKPLVKSALEAIKEEKIDNSNKVEPKPKLGDWIVKKNIVYHIDKISGVYLTLSTLDGRALVYHKNVLDSDKIHLWTIADARDGDILVSEYNKPFIYNGKHISDSIGAHCGINIHDQFTVSTTEYDWTDYDVKPATKEQSDLLFQEIKEMGWEWDAEKKKLKRMQKAKWSEEDSKAIDSCCLLIGAADDSYEKAFKDDCIHYLLNLKQRMEQ